MERWLESHVCGAFSDGYTLRPELGQVTGMIKWDEQRLKELVRKMGLRRTPGQGKPPIHLSLYGSRRTSRPLLAAILELGLDEWALLGYTETDRVSVTRYLGSLKCRTDGAFPEALSSQQPLALDLASALIDAGACDDDGHILSIAAYRQPLTMELVKLLMDAGCNPSARRSSGWDTLVCLAHSGRSVLPQVTDLFLSAGCRTDLSGCENISNTHRLRFTQILQEYAAWKAEQLNSECAPTECDLILNWGW